jgi:acyl carrier protein
VVGDKRLVAYIIPRNGHQPVPAELRDYLRERLPDFMIPSHFVTLDAFPLTPNKKIDRKVLPAPNQVVIEQRESAFVQPQNPLQQQIAAIWQDLLGVPSVGIHDNFFDLGGHSLLAVQAHRRISETTGKELTVTDLFRFTTIHALVDHLNQQNGEAHAAEASLDKSISRAERRKQRMERR